MKTEDPFDRLLERAARPPDDAQPPVDCLDAETLAAWADRTLTASERAAAETHAADCDRCLALLAAMAKTEPPAQVEVERARGSWLSVRWMAPLAAASIAIVVWALVQTPVERSPQVVSAPSPPIDAVTPATPSAPAERDATAQARTRTAEVEQKQARNDVRQQAAAKAPGRDEERGKREHQETTVSPQSKVRSAPADAPAASRDSAAALLRAVRTPTVIASPDPSVRWQFAGPVVERSTDAGVTWISQATGSPAVLSAGASPSPTVCWIVGQAGTILLTTDGATWSRLDFPDPKADLVAIAARDGGSATVTASDGRTYRTDDGGKTWRVQENPVAAF